MKDNRLKRWMREHRKPKGGRIEPRTPPAGAWVFHKATWGDFEVVVLPRTVQGQAFDSNTGIVTAAPFHAYLMAAAIVSDGRAMNCDLPALQQICGPEGLMHGHPFTIPTYRVTDQDRKTEGYQMALQAVMEGQRKPRESAIAECDKVLGWAPYSMTCKTCKLEISGVSPADCMAQARAFGWKRRDYGRDSFPVCTTHAGKGSLELWTDEQLAAYLGPVY